MMAGKIRLHCRDVSIRLSAFRLNYDRGTLKAELLTQPVDQRALDRKMHLAGFVSENDEGRRSDRRLRNVVDPNIAFKLQRLVKPIQLSGGDSL
jgi:hypothetical protein